MPDTDPEIAIVRARVQVMRELGIVEAFGIRLGPQPAEQAGDDTQQAKPMSDMEREAHDRAEHRRVALGASGSVLRRLHGRAID